MAEKDRTQCVPVSSMRAAIGRLMTKSFTTAPHFFNFETIDASSLLAYRKSSGEQTKPTVKDMIVYVTSRALRVAPELNSHWAGDHIEQFDAVNIGMIVAVKDGLINQVLCDADKKSLPEISAESKALIEKAHAGKIASGKASFTVSNLGPNAPMAFTGIINPPQAAILAVGRIYQAVIVDESSQPAVRPVCNVCLSCDHKMVDGRSPANFLGRFKEICEAFTGSAE